MGTLNVQSFLPSGGPAGVSIGGAAGGNGGRPFTDAAPSANLEVGKIDIWAGSHIDAIQITYRDKGSQRLQGSVRHGGRGGQLVFSHVLQPHEYIAAIYGRHGDVIDSMSIQTNVQTFLRVGGGGGASEYALQAPQSPTVYEIIGFFGREGDVLDQIGILCRQRVG